MDILFVFPFSLNILQFGKSYYCEIGETPDDHHSENSTPVQVAPGAPQYLGKPFQSRHSPKSAVCLKSSFLYLYIVQTA